MQLTHVNQDTYGSIEVYHGLIKRRDLGACKCLSGRQIGWLVHILTSSNKSTSNVKEQCLELHQASLFYSLYKYSNECYKFATSNDGFGNTVRRSKPFWKICIKLKIRKNIIIWSSSKGDQKIYAGEIGYWS